ncbi:MAG: hypothetical protein HOB72_18030 [Rhodospirillaceae bacterium]|nr:hypothetical protein [Rhodospirillaceae bacterium]
MHDLVIRGGVIVDGSGAEKATGDVAIDGDRLSQVGGTAGAAREEIDADGGMSRLSSLIARECLALAA